MSDCPSRDQLTRLLEGTPTGEAAGLAEHLQSCEACCVVLARLADQAGPSLPKRQPLRHVPAPAFLDRMRRQPPAALEQPSISAPRPAVPYEILGELGRGGMGVVYKARQPGLHREVALKVIRAGTHASPAEVDRFRREAALAARLQHPNIVQIHDICERDSQACLVLEYVRGGSLAARLAGQGLEAREAAALVETLARAVHYAHERGVLHRDLKPANVLLADDGTAKIADFGLARDRDAAPASDSGSFAGTPSYMAPEQTRGRAEVLGPAVDIYGLGALLYEGLTGRPPFKAATPFETLLRVAHEDPVPPRRLQPRLPRDLETICLACLRKAPARRYPTAAALADDLRRFLDGIPIRARTTPAWERAYRWSRRHPARALLAAAAVLLAIVAFSYTLALRQSEKRVRANLVLVAVKNHELADELASMISYTLKAGDKVTARSQIAKADEAFHSTEELFRRLVRDEPGEPAAVFGLGLTLAAQAKHCLYNANRVDPAAALLDEAIPLLETARILGPANEVWPKECARAHATRADVFLRLHRLEDSVASRSRAIEWGEGDFCRRERLHRAKTLARLGRLDEATADAEALVAEGAIPGWEGTFYDLATVYALALRLLPGDGAQAERYGRRAVEILTRERETAFFKDPKNVKEFLEDDDLSPLRGREDFRAFCRTLEVDGKR